MKAGPKLVVSKQFPSIGSGSKVILLVEASIAKKHQPIEINFNQKQKAPARRLSGGWVCALLPPVIWCPPPEQIRTTYSSLLFILIPVHGKLHFRKR